MSKELELYKAFIDGLVERKDSMTALWVKGDGFPKTEDNKAKNDLLATLTPEQKGVLAEMLQEEHIAGIHDTLAYINEMMDDEEIQEMARDVEALRKELYEAAGRNRDYHVKAEDMKNLLPDWDIAWEWRICYEQGSGTV